jgi:hypothetical protein
MVAYKYVIETKRTKCYTKSAPRGGRVVAGGNGKKKARYGSGLNLSLEENRGDRCIMLHRKKEIQFIFVMTVINELNSAAEPA